LQTNETCLGKPNDLAMCNERKLFALPGLGIGCYRLRKETTRYQKRNRAGDSPVIEAYRGYNGPYKGFKIP
jgi:hypothetical protein